jgi:hypothetical protein
MSYFPFLMNHPTAMRWSSHRLVRQTHQVRWRSAAAAVPLAATSDTCRLTGVSGMGAMPDMGLSFHHAATNDCAPAAGRCGSGSAG